MTLPGAARPDHDGPVTRPSEDALIARFFAPLATSAGADGLTDDAAVIPPGEGDLVVTKDMAVAGCTSSPMIRRTSSPPRPCG